MRANAIFKWVELCTPKVSDWILRRSCFKLKDKIVHQVNKTMLQSILRTAKSLTYKSKISLYLSDKSHTNGDLYHMILMLKLMDSSFRYWFSLNLQILSSFQLIVLHLMRNKYRDKILIWLQWKINYELCRSLITW